MIKVHLFKGIGAEYADLCFDRMASMETTAMEDYKADARKILQLFNACLPIGTLTELKRLLSDSEMDERADLVEPKPLTSKQVLKALAEMPVIHTPVPHIVWAGGDWYVNGVPLQPDQVVTGTLGGLYIHLRGKES